MSLFSLLSLFETCVLLFSFFIVSCSILNTIVVAFV